MAIKHTAIRNWSILIFINTQLSLVSKPKAKTTVINILANTIAPGLSLSMYICICIIYLLFTVSACRPPWRQLFLSHLIFMAVFRIFLGAMCSCRITRLADVFFFQCALPKPICHDCLISAGPTAVNGNCRQTPLKGYFF